MRQRLPLPARQPPPFAGSAARQLQRCRISTAAWGLFGGGDEGAPIEEEKEELDPSAPLAWLEVDENTTSELQ